MGALESNSDPGKSFTIFESPAETGGRNEGLRLLWDNVARWTCTMDRERAAIFSQRSGTHPNHTDGFLYKWNWHKEPTPEGGELQSFHRTQVKKTRHVSTLLTKQIVCPGVSWGGGGRVGEGLPGHGHVPALFMSTRKKHTTVRLASLQTATSREHKDVSLDSTFYLLPPWR